MHFDVAELIRSVGLIGIFFIVFAESGLLVGAFLPGDSLLFTAGFLASQGYLAFPVLAIGVALSAIGGDAVGYAFGKRFGRKLYDRPDSRWFKAKHLRAAEAFYAKHGGKTIIIARFLPIVRTFAPIVAGMSDMRYRRFVVFNVIGAFLWGVGVTGTGYLLGNVIPDVDRYLLPIIAAIVLVSVLPSAYHVIANYDGGLAGFISMLRREAGELFGGRESQSQPD